MVLCTSFLHRYTFLNLVMIIDVNISTMLIDGRMYLSTWRCAPLPTFLFGFRTQRVQFRTEKPMAKNYSQWRVCSMLRCAQQFFYNFQMIILVLCTSFIHRCTILNLVMIIDVNSSTILPPPYVPIFTWCCAPLPTFCLGFEHRGSNAEMKCR